MNLSFKTKLLVTFALFSVVVTSLSVHVLYNRTQTMMMSQIGDHLRDIAQMSLYLFQPEDRQMIAELTARVEQASRSVTETMLNPADDRVIETLPPSLADELMATSEFHRLVQILRQIKIGTYKQIHPNPWQPIQFKRAYPDSALIKFAYIFIRVPESPDYRVMRFLADANYEGTRDTEGVKIGTLYHSQQNVFQQAFHGQAMAGDDFIVDRWGSYISAAVPIMDPDGKVLAILGLDYDVSDESNQLRQLNQWRWMIMAISLFLSLVLAYGLARWLYQPIAILRQGAERVKNRDFDTRIDLPSNDELGLLAETFNSMIAEVKTYATSLEEKIIERTRDLNNARLEAEEARAEAEAANKVKTQFLANMSHELRTPLTAIIGYSELLEEDAEDNDWSEMIPDLQKIQVSSRYLLELIEALLDLSKIEAGKISLYAENFSVKDLVDEVVMQIEPLVGRKGNALTVDVSAKLGEMINDRTKVKQILINILGNACKFTENGTISLSGQRRVTADKNWIEFKIRDTGVGMTADQMRKIFDSFTQADDSISRKFGGTGLGLTISKKFAEMMGGRIEVESQQQEGSTFTVVLPEQISR